jgi:hypothetical protein
MLYVFCGIGTHSSYSIFNLLDISAECFDPDQIDSQPKRKLCIDDSKQTVLETYFLYLV